MGVAWAWTWAFKKGIKRRRYAGQLINTSDLCGKHLRQRGGVLTYTPPWKTPSEGGEVKR